MLAIPTLSTIPANIAPEMQLRARAFSERLRLEIYFHRRMLMKCARAVYRCFLSHQRLPRMAATAVHVLLLTADKEARKEITLAGNLFALPPTPTLTAVVQALIRDGSKHPLNYQILFS